MPSIDATWVVGLVCLTFGIGCSSPAGSFQSTRDPAYTARLARVLIVYHNDEAAQSDLGQHFGQEFLARLTELLSARGVDSEWVRPAWGSPDTNAPIREATARFRPRQLLHFGPILMRSQHQTRRTTVNSLPQFKHETSVTFECILADYRRKEPVWRSTMRYTVLPEAKIVADQLVDRLTGELLLDPP